MAKIPEITSVRKLPGPTEKQIENERLIQREMWGEIRKLPPRDPFLWEIGVTKEQTSLLPGAACRDEVERLAKLGMVPFLTGEEQPKKRRKR